MSNEKRGISTSTSFCIIIVVAILTFGYVITHTQIVKTVPEIKEIQSDTNKSVEEIIPDFVARGIVSIQLMIENGVVKTGIGSSYYISKTDWNSLPDKELFTRFCALHFISYKRGNILECTIYNIDNKSEKFAYVDIDHYIEYELNKENTKGLL